MATVETTKPIPGSSKVGPVTGAGLFSLVVAANRFRTYWSKSRGSEVEERIISLDEVLWHDNSDDCWVVIYDRVYDITKFLYLHPGGHDVLLENAGRDVTLAFRGTGHSQEAVDALKPFLIGHLPKSECIYRINGGISCSDMPE